MFARRRQWHPTPVLLPGKSHGHRSLEGCSPWGREGRTRLSDFTFTFHFQASEKEMATHSSVLAWRIPGMGEPGGLLSMGSHRVRHYWSNLAAAAKCLQKLLVISVPLKVGVLNCQCKFWKKKNTDGIPLKCKSLKNLRKKLKIVKQDTGEYSKPLKKKTLSIWLFFQLHVHFLI